MKYGSIQVEDTVEVENTVEIENARLYIAI